jgi:DNA-binding NarL/FixJ family response regulator
MISVILVDDHPLLRLGIKRFLEKAPDIDIAGEFGDIGAVNTWLAQKGKADVALLDRWLTDGDGLDLGEQLKRRGMKVIMLTMEEDEAEISEAFERGVDGYLLKSSDGDKVVSTIRAVVEGNSIFPAHIMQKIARGELSSDPFAKLSHREREIAACVAQGLSNKVIGARLHLSDNTVRNHLANIMEKLGLTNRVQVAALALKHFKNKPGT